MSDDPEFTTYASVPPTTKRQRLVRRLARGRFDAAGNYFLLIVSLGLGFFSQVVVARLTGVSGYGEYVYALAWASIVVQPALLGLDRILIRELAVYNQARSFGLMRGLLRRSNQTAAVGAGILTILVAGIALPISSNAIRVSVAFGLATIPFAALGRVRLATLQGLKLAALGQLTQSVARTAYFILFIGIAAAVAGSLDMRPETAVAMQALAFAAALVTGSIAVRRVLPREVMRSVPEFEGRRWAKSLPLLALFTGLTILNSQLPVIMLGAIGTTADTGRFNAAWRGAAIVPLALAALGPVIAPRIAAAFASGKKSEIERILSKGSQGAVALAVPPALFLALAGPWFLGLFGPDFREADAALTVLVVAQLFNVATGMTVNALLMTNHERSAVLAVAVATCTNVALCAVLIPAWDALGAALAATASLVVLNSILVAAVIRRLDVSPAPWLAFLRRRAVDPML